MSRRKAERMERAKQAFMRAFVEDVVDSSIRTMPDGEIGIHCHCDVDLDDGAGGYFDDWRDGILRADVYEVACELVGGAQDGERVRQPYVFDLLSVLQLLSDEPGPHGSPKQLWCSTAGCPSVFVAGCYMGMWVVIACHLHEPPDDVPPSMFLDSATGQDRDADTTS